VPCDLLHLMEGDVTVGDSGRPESMSRSATMLWRACMAVFVVMTATSWVTALWLSRLPRTDGSGRGVLYFYWNHTSNFWFGWCSRRLQCCLPSLPQVFSFRSFGMCMEVGEF